MRNHIINLALLALATSVMIYLYGTINYTSEQFQLWDLHDYRKMAEAAPHLSNDVFRPFAYRILGPYLAGLMPLPVDTSFYVLAIAASYSVVGLFYGFLCFVGLRPSIAAICTFLFTTNKYFFGLTVWDYFQLNNVLSLSLVLVMFWAMLTDRWKVFAAALFVGAFAREVNMMMLPVALFYLWRNGELRQSGSRLLLLTAPAVIAFILLRAFMPVSGGDTLVMAIEKNVPMQLTPLGGFRWLVNSFAPLTLIPLVFFGFTVRFFKERLYAIFFMLLVSTGLCFGMSTEMYMAPTFVIFYWLIGSIFQEFRWNWITISAVTVCCGAASIHHAIGRFPLSTNRATMVVSVIALLAATVVAAIARSRRSTELTAAA